MCNSKDKFINLGFSIKKRTYDILYGIGIGLLIMSIGYALLLSCGEISFNNINFDLSDILFSIIIFTLVAIVEETLIRGYVLKNLMLSFDKYIALIISSLLFATLHLANPNMNFLSFLDLFLAGIFLGISYIYTKNLWFPIALHFSWNLFQSFLGFNVSGQDMYSIIEFKIKENNILNGGDFGFEGSIFSIIFQLIFIVIFYYYFRKQDVIN